MSFLKLGLIQQITLCLVLFNSIRLFANECPKAKIGSGNVVRSANGFNPWYKKSLKHSGLVFLGSELVCDRSLQLAAEIFSHMLMKRPDILKRLVEQKHQISIFAINQKHTDVPENQDLRGTFHDTSCGGGGNGSRPTSICESNLLQIRGLWDGMSVAVHELGHTIMNLGLDESERNAIGEAYRIAKIKKLYPKQDAVTPSYMMSNEMEYFAESTGIWFGTADNQNPANSPEEKNRDHLKKYDPDLYSVLAKIYSSESWTVPKP